MWKNKKREFPFQTHIAIGVLWIIIGVVIMSGPWSLFWILIGLVFIAIGFLAMREKLKKPISNS